MQIFLSYSKADKSVAERIATGLRAEDHEVFFDQTDLPAGESYDSQIRAAVESSDLFVFLISPDSLEKGRYTRTELSHARRRWENPTGRILPVMVRPTPYADLPGYLTTVTVLEPAGNIPADVAAAVNRLRRRSRGTLARRLLIAGGAVIGLALVTAVAIWVASSLGDRGDEEITDGGVTNDPQRREQRYLVEWFRDFDPDNCVDVDVSLPDGIVVAREQNNELFRFGSCDLSIEAAALELIGDVRLAAFSEAASAYSGSATGGSAMPVAEGVEENHDGINGAPGRRGASGKNGAGGKNAGVLELDVDEWRGTGTLFADLRGQDGERGKNGGLGGQGQQGATGEKAESGIVRCKRGPGTGGDGGPGGAGGGGGDGGAGGDGGLVYLSPAAEKAIATGRLGVDVSGGGAGNAGAGGACGAPGDPGRRGLGSTLCKVKEAPWRWGNAGQGCLGQGAGGKQGEDGQAGQTAPITANTSSTRSVQLS